MKSISFDQISGKDVSLGVINTKCSPVVRIRDLSMNNVRSIGGNLLKDDDLANPCGLPAKSFFNGISIYLFILFAMKKKLVDNINLLLIGLF